MPFSITELEDVIRRRAFKDLIGQIEGDVLDCKRQPYELGTDAGKLALAKDVQSFANHQGGIILIGLGTTKASVSHDDEITDLSPVPSTMVKPPQYIDIVRSLVYPEVVGLSVTWTPADEADASKGVIVIRVPKQKESAKPFLTQMVVIDGTKVSTLLFGYSVRTFDKNVALSPEELHKYISQGMQSERLENQIAGLQQLVEKALAVKEGEESRKELSKLTDERIERATKGA